MLANGGGTIDAGRERDAARRGAHAGLRRASTSTATATRSTRVRFYTPNITNTHRYGLTASLIWDINDDQRVRVAYTLRPGQHRQTGEWGFLDGQRHPESVFGGRNATPVLAADGFQLQQRDRKSIALLNQFAGQYIGRFMDDRLRLEVGLRAPFFERDLETFCPIQAATASPIAPANRSWPADAVVAPPARRVRPDLRHPGRRADQPGVPPPLLRAVRGEV